jgi:uncharacterized protein (TIGR00297 family)
VAAVKSLPPGELARKLVHMGVGGIAFALRFLGPLGSAACALGAVLFNYAVLPRVGGKRLWRDVEAGRGHAIGILLYPVAVLLLVLLFWRRLEVAAAAWGILAFGDGMASVAGMTLGSRKLPWNARKSWAGTLAYVLFGTLGAGILLQWTAPGRYDATFAWLVALAAALLAAALESLPEGLDDNLGVPLVSALFLAALLLTDGRWASWLADPALPGRLLIGCAINAVLAAAGLATGGVNRSGMIAGFLVGTLIYACLDWPGYLLLLAFFVLGTGATKLGYARKASERIAQEEGGRRGAKHALAKTAVPAACALFAVTTPQPELFRLAFAAAFATAASDTAASEIGKLWGRRTFLITSFRPVPRGTDGAVSLEGTLAGVAASFLIAGLGIASGLLDAAAWWILPLAAFVATTLESLIGATLERRGLLGNEAVNFLNTLAGGLAAFALGAVR